jgi:hypothetical protein
MLDPSESAFVRGHMIEALQEIQVAWTAPHVLMRPKLALDGNQWCALYGENLQEGVAGFGDTPAGAMQAFDQAWMYEKAKIAPTSTHPALDGIRDYLSNRVEFHNDHEASKLLKALPAQDKTREGNRE